MSKCACQNPPFGNPSTRRTCNYGNCSLYFCDLCGKNDWGSGPISCPCDNTRGWNRQRLEQMGKPHPPVKVKGRSAGKIQRRRREQARHKAWLRTVEAMLAKWDAKEES